MGKTVSRLVRARFSAQKMRIVSVEVNGSLVKYLPGTFTAPRRARMLGRIGNGFESPTIRSEPGSAYPRFIRGPELLPWTFCCLTNVIPLKHYSGTGYMFTRANSQTREPLPSSPTGDAL